MFLVPDQKFIVLPHHSHYGSISCKNLQLADQNPQSGKHRTDTPDSLLELSGQDGTAGRDNPQCLPRFTQAHILSTLSLLETSSMRDT